MKILFFCRLFYPHIGGVEKHVYELSRELVKRGHSVTIVTEKFDRETAGHQKVEGMIVYRIPTGKNEQMKKYRIWQWLFKHKKLIGQADVVHCHDVFFWYIPFRFLYPFKKVFVTFHGYEGNSIPGKRAVFMHSLAKKLSYGNISVGAFLQKWYGTRANFVTYGAVAEPNEKIRYRPILRPDRVYAAFLGRLEEETGIMLYLQALKIALSRGYTIHTVVLGDGELLEEAERFVKRHNLPVRFKGFVRDTDKYISEIHFVFTSRYLGILESLSLKRFVFAVYNNAIKEDYLRMSPFAKYISITKDDLSLAEEIVFHVQNQQVAQKKALEGYAWAKNQTWEQLADVYLQLWTKVRKAF